MSFTEKMAMTSELISGAGKWPTLLFDGKQERQKTENMLFDAEAKVTRLDPTRPIKLEG